MWTGCAWPRFPKIRDRATEHVFHSDRGSRVTCLGGSVDRVSIGQPPLRYSPLCRAPPAIRRSRRNCSVGDKKPNLWVSITLRMHSFLRQPAKLCAGEIVPHLALILKRSQSGDRLLIGRFPPALSLLKFRGPRTEQGGQPFSFQEAAAIG
jgi:hypothetical protein